MPRLAHHRTVQTSPGPGGAPPDHCVAQARITPSLLTTGPLFRQGPSSLSQAWVAGGPSPTSRLSPARGSAYRATIPRGLGRSSRRRHFRASRLRVRPSAARSMPPISWRDRDCPRPLWARGLLSFPLCGRTAEAPAATHAALDRGPGLKCLAGRSHLQATGLSADSGPRLRGTYLCARHQGIFLRGQPGPINSQRRPDGRARDSASDHAVILATPPTTFLQCLENRKH
ncbi:hypothetical protein NDU88_004575 [Pleurodeles waltl]|uniref:Uncharacterized protein n=1 Tax=Pleurodeles waltl TaxID=8319 RepID=A0AAV7LLS2_PLEWA|nr:hypothetical protein NDU88_004575 [Pleurodeles waltl]